MDPIFHHELLRTSATAMKLEDNNLAQWVKHPSLGKIRLETQETKLMSYCSDFQGPSVSATASQSHS